MLTREEATDFCRFYLGKKGLRPFFSDDYPDKCHIFKFSKKPNLHNYKEALKLACDSLIQTFIEENEFEPTKVGVVQVTHDFKLGDPNMHRVCDTTLVVIVFAELK